MKHRILITLVALGGLTAVPAYAQQGQGTLMRALDEPLTMTIPDKPITLALDDLAGRTGLAIRLDDDVLALLPHGEETRLRVTARNVKLRDVLSAMLAPMCLQWRVQEREVVVTASDPLRRIGRRPTFTEVEILAKLAGAKLTADQPVIEQMRRITGIEELRLLWHLADPSVRDKAVAAAGRRLPSTGSQYMDHLCHGKDLTWYVWGTDLMIVSKDIQAARQLGRILSVRYQGQPLQTVIVDLAHRAGLEVKMDPGVLNVVGAETRSNFTLMMSQATAAEAFEAISGATGLTFEPEGLALRVGAADGVVAQPVPSTPRKRAAFIVTMKFKAADGRDYAVLLRPDDLPKPMVEAITRQKAELIETLHKEYGVTTRPAPAR